ncbi:MAG: thermonuclease family protein [Candidatus Rokuibacteriota bacterium]
MMSRGGSALSLLLLVLADIEPTTPAEGRRVAAQVVHVSDGDTLVARLAELRSGLKKEETVRLVGLDCPETGQAPWGFRATAMLRRLVRGRPVILEVGVQPRDSHGRLLAGVYLSDGKTLVQERLVREGLCQPLVIQPNVDYVEQLHAAKAEAQRAERGIWARTDGLTENPGDYRRRHR